MAWQTPPDLKYLKTDEWVRIEGDDATIGISDFAQDQLNDIVYVELPSVGDDLKVGERLASVESVKAASEVFAPVAGEVVEVNAALGDEPGMVNQSPEDAGWFLKLKLADKSEADALMDADAYKAFLETI